MKDGLIGVIVPVYKVEKYIAECIKSILAQTYTNFRLILVDDGTPDNAGKICEEYAKKDTRITVIHQENACVTRARARGVEEAKDCEFITFVDGDDTIKKRALEYLLMYMHDNTDIVITPVDKNINKDNIYICINDYRKLVVKNASLIDTPWGKLFRNKLFNEFIFDIPAKIKVHEDSLMNIRIAFNTKKDVAICKEEIYNYRYNVESIFNTFYKDLEYEQLYHEYRIKSIPANLIDSFLINTIPTRLLRWQEIYLYKYTVTGMNKTPFYVNLKKDIEKTKYQIPLIKKILFYNSNSIFRFIVINFQKLINIITKPHA